MDFCKLIVLGRVGQGKDSEKFKLEYTATGVATCRSSVAVSSGQKVDGQWVNKTMWLNLRMFGAQAEKFANSVNTGDAILIDGRLDESSYVDKTGQQRTSQQVIVNSFVITKPKHSENTSHSTEPYGVSPDPEIDPEVSDVLDGMSFSGENTPPPPVTPKNRKAKAGAEEDRVPF